MSSNQLNDISKVYMEAVYGGGKKEEKDTRMVVTNADKKANTPAYQKYKAGSKAYKAADHLKDNYEFARHKASVISRGGRLEDAVESWNQKVAHQEAMNNVSEKKEVNVKDTYKTVAAIVDYDRSKKGSKDATYDSEHGEKGKAKKERDYAAWERSKMKKDDPNWKSKKYHTGMHGEDKDWGYDKKGNSLNPVDIEKKKRKDDNLAGAPRVKKESLSDWRTDLNSLIEIVAEPEEKAEKKVKEGKVNNKVVINPKISEAIQEMGGEVLEHHQVDCDDDCEPNCEHDVAEGKVKKEIKALSTAARTLKGRNVAKADAIEEGKGKKNCGCGQDPCITYGEQKEGDSLGKSQVEESEKLAQKAYDRAQKLGAKRRAKQGVNRGVGKSERAGYNLAQSQRSRNTDAATQGGPQTGGGPKSYGYARNKSNPVKSKSVGDTGATGHYKKRDQKVTSKSGKTTRYKLKFRDRMDHHVSKRQELKDPKKNPKHTANTQKEENFFSRFRNI